MSCQQQKAQTIAQSGERTRNELEQHRDLVLLLTLLIAVDVWVIAMC